METLLQDFQFAVRMMRKNLGFTTAAVLCYLCSGVVCPTFLPHLVFTEADVKLLRAMGVDPEVGTIEGHLRTLSEGT